MASRWIRLDTTWDSSKWVAALPAPSQLAWIKLLCYMKAHGDSRSVKILCPEVASRQWTVTKHAVINMLDAAITDGALVVDGDEWVITGWYRQTDTTQADRSRRYRQRRKELKDTVTTVTRDVTPVTHTETETETKREKRARTLPKDWSPNANHRKIADEEGVDLDREVLKFRDHAESNGRVLIKWDQGFNNWLRSAYNSKQSKRGKPTMLERKQSLDEVFDKAGIL